MKLSVDRMCFDECMTVYDFAARFAVKRKGDCTGVQAAKVFEDEHFCVKIVLDGAVNLLDAGQVASLIGCRSVVFSKRGTTQYICGIK